MGVMMKKAVLAVIVLLSLAAAPALAASFEEGQIWRYQTRPGEEASRLFIARIHRGLGTQSIYHIYVDGQKLKNPPYEGGVQDYLPHARSEEHTSELQSLLRISSAVFYLNHKTYKLTQLSLLHSRPTPISNAHHSV